MFTNLWRIVPEKLRYFKFDARYVSKLAVTLLKIKECSVESNFDHCQRGGDDMFSYTVKGNKAWKS